MCQSPGVSLVAGEDEGRTLELTCSTRAKPAVPSSIPKYPAW